MKISNLARSAAADAVVDMLDAGGAGSLEVRTGSAPTETTDADSGTLLSTHALSATAYGAASSGVATANSIGSATAAASGVPGHWRKKSGAGTVIAQGTAGASGQELNFSGLVGGQIISGGTVTISSFTYTQPAGS